MDETLTLYIKRRQASNVGSVAEYEINGNAGFIWEELGTLLVDPLLMSLSLERESTGSRGEKQVIV